MSVRLTQFVAEYYKLLVRGCVVILGCAAVCWGIIEFPIFWKEAAAEGIAGRVIAGDAFKAEILVRQIAIIDGVERSGYCRPAALRSAAIIQLRMVEVAPPAKDQEQRNEHLNALSNVIRSALSCSPADPFLWLVLYWVEGTRNGYKSDHLKYLKMSYRLGPNEGWIGLKRNALAFENFDQLSIDLRELVIAEFIGLLKSGFEEQAADILSGPAWQLRNQLLPHLKSIDERQRKALEYYVSKRRSDVLFPNIER